MTDQITVPRETWDALRGALGAIISAHPVSTSLRQTDAVIAARQALTAANAVQPQAQGEAVYLVATGETHNGEETYCRYDYPPALSEFERLYTHPQATEPSGWKLVSVIPTEEQWGGLARDIMMWMDMDGRKTAGSLFKHLERCGTSIPQWLRDEPEMKNLDHVPSKGTRVTIIYRAMLAAAPEAKQ